MTLTLLLMEEGTTPCMMIYRNIVITIGSHHCCIFEEQQERASCTEPITASFKSYACSIKGLTGEDNMFLIQLSTSKKEEIILVTIVGLCVHPSETDLNCYNQLFRDDVQRQEVQHVNQLSTLAAMSQTYYCSFLLCHQTRLAYLFLPSLVNMLVSS